MKGKLPRDSGSDSGKHTPRVHKARQRALTSKQLHSRAGGVDTHCRDRAQVKSAAAARCALAPAFQPTCAVDVCAPFEINKTAPVRRISASSRFAVSGAFFTCPRSRQGMSAAGRPVSRLGRPAAPRGESRCSAPCSGRRVAGIGPFPERAGACDGTSAQGGTRLQRAGASPLEACSRHDHVGDRAPARRAHGLSRGACSPPRVPSPESPPCALGRSTVPELLGLEMERGEQWPWKARGAWRGLQESAGLAL